MTDAAENKEEVPGHVAIVGLGPSSLSYIHLTESHGGRHTLFDEVWVINTYGDVLDHDRVFFMDDLENVQREIADESIDERVRAKLIRMMAWLKDHPGPVYTSIANPEFKGMVEYPLEDVLNVVGTAYFNNSVAYAVVYAIYIGVKRISLFGCDYAYGKEEHEGVGRACTEFWMGVAAAKGIEVSVSDKSTLMDSVYPDRKFYGYEAWKVEPEQDPKNKDKIKVNMTRRVDVVATVDLESQ